MDRGFGEVYKALEKRSGMYVAIKKIRLLGYSASLPPEQEILLKCNSPFIVRYIGVIPNENELWVRFRRSDDEIDYYGVMPLWLPCSIYEKRKSAQ